MLHLSLRTMACSLLICIFSLNVLAPSTTLAQVPEAVASFPISQLGKTEKIAPSNPVVERPSEATTTMPESHQNAATQSSPSVVFIENIGQFDPQVRFQTQIEKVTAHFMQDSIWLTLLEEIDPVPTFNPSPFEFTKQQELPAMKARKGVHIKLDVMGSNPHPEIVPFERIETHYSYYLGVSADDFRSDVPAWQGIRYVDIFPGMDMEIKSAGDHVVWEFVISDPTPFYENNRNIVDQGIRLHVAGQKKLNLKNGSVDVVTDLGSLVLPEIFLDGNQVFPELDHNQMVIPVPPQTARVPTVESHFHSTAYEINAVSHFIKSDDTASVPTLLGPSDALLYSSYIGGSVPLFQYDPFAHDIGSGLAVAGNEVYFTGITQSADFLQGAVPQNTGIFDALSNVVRPFIAKLNIDTNQFEFISYFYLDHYCYAGGYYHILTGRFFSIQVDALGNVFAGGANPRTDFPMVNPIDNQVTGTCYRTLDGQWYHPTDGFLIELNPTGTQLLFSSYLGGLYEDKITNIALDPSGALYAAGYTYSNDIPALAGGYDTSQNGGLDVFVTKIYANSGSQAYFSYLGGSSTDNPYGITVGQDGSLYIAGRTFSTNFTNLPPGNTCPTCLSDGFVVKLDPTGGLAYSRYLGGTAGEVGFSVAVDQSNQAYLVGVTSSPDFPIATTKTDIDTFVLKLNTAGDTVYAERLGGATDDFGMAIAVDSTGKIYIAGETLSMDFPWTPNAYDQTGDAQRDLFISKLDPEAKMLLYSTYLGGSSTETIAPYIIVNNQGEVYLQVSQTISSDFPYTANAFDTTYNGNIDMMIVKLATNIPLVDCSGVTLSPIAQAVQSQTGEYEYYCSNYYDSDNGDGEIGLISLPPGQAGFQRLGTLAKAARYEVDFVTMGWDPYDSAKGDSPGTIFLQEIKTLYEQVKDPVGHGLSAGYYSRGVKVRILLGLKYYTFTGCQDQRLIVMNDLARLGIDLNNPVYGWTIEVASYRGASQLPQCGLEQASGMHSHVKLLVVDGKNVIAAGYNLHYNYLGVDPVHDMGVQISGPIAQRSLAVFDELWADANRCDNTSCTQESQTESFVQGIPHDWLIRMPYTIGNSVAFSLFRNHVYKTADNAIVAAIRAANSEVNILQNRFVYSTWFPPEYGRAVLDVLQKENSQVNVNILTSGGLEDLPGNVNGMCNLYSRLFDEAPLRIPNLRFRLSSIHNPIHTKSVSVDDSFLIVGSQNFDPSAWGSDPLSFGDLAEYSLAVDGYQAAGNFQTKFDAEWSSTSNTAPLLCLTLSGLDTLQDAVDRAETGSIIFVPAGVLNQPVTISKPLTLVGAGANQSIIRPQGNEPAFMITSSDVTIMNMKVSGGNGYGIKLIDSSPNSLKNIHISSVVFENNTQGGILAQGLIAGSPMNYAIENNTFVGGVDGVTINMIGTQTETSLIRNNIFSGQSNAPIHILSTSDSHVEYSYNLFYSCGMGNCAANWHQGNLSVSSSAHNNLFDVNPLFKNTAGGAYQLSTGSPAIDAGDPSLQSDLYQDGNNDGVARVDIGAFEYVYSPVANAVPVVNAGNDKAVELGSNVTVNATYSDADNTENHSAKIDWGDGTIEDVPVNMTGPGVGEVNGVHLYANIGTYTAEVCVTDPYGGVGCDTVNVTVLPSNLLFSDGFESGDFSRWSWVDASSNLTVSTQAATVGNYGMKAAVTNTNTLMVYDSSPVNQKHYSARFYFNPNSINIPNGQGTYLFTGSDNIGWVMCLDLKHIGQSYLLNLCSHDDARIWQENDGIYINNAWTEVELEWQAATAPGANNGYLKLWINDTLVDSIQNIDSDTLFVKNVSLGVDIVPANTTGAIYFDAFESRAGSHIGLDANGPSLYQLPLPPDAVFADGFESNNLNAWHASETNGGKLSTSTQAHAVGSYGMQAVLTGSGSIAANMTQTELANLVVTPDDPFYFNPDSVDKPSGLVNLLTSTGDMNVYDNTPKNEKHYDARFYFNPNSVNLPNGQGMYLFAASDEHWVSCVYLERKGAYYRLWLCGQDNNLNWIENRYVYITNDWQAIEVEWQAASAPGANNGYMKLFINDVLADEIENLNNDARAITQVNLGTSGIPSGTIGTVYFDAFESRRNTHIGPDPNGPSRSPVNTGWVNPTANAAVTSGAGDNNGFQTTPTNAYNDGGGFAVDTDSGSNTSTSCSDSGKDRHVFYAYGLSSIPSGSSILGIEVRLDMKVDSTNGSPNSCIQLSWDGGATWSAAKTTTTFSTTETTYTLGGTSDTWGHTWTTSELSNLRVRITDISSKNTSDFSLDWIALRVTYLQPMSPLPLIFTDGFETGDLSSWNYVTNENGKLSVSTASAMFGSYGMQAIINNTTALYAQDLSPAKETYYNVRFYFDPHSISIPNGSSFYILNNDNLRILLKNNAGTYQLRADIYKEDTSSWMTGSLVNITNSRQMLEVEWKAASSAQVHDGYLKFWINDSLVNTLSNVDNDTRVITYTNLGAMWAIPSGTSGTVYFDNFESRNTGHIGP